MQIAHTSVSPSGTSAYARIVFAFMFWVNNENISILCESLSRQVIYFRHYSFSAGDRVSVKDISHSEDKLDHKR